MVLNSVLRGLLIEAAGSIAAITAAPENTLATDKNKPLAGLGLFAASLLADYGATLFIVIAPRISPGR